MENSKSSSSKKEIYDRLLTIASKYTDIENTDYLKTGLFGYVTEAMAMMMRDSSLHKEIIYNESSLNTAVAPKTIYNWAKTFNVEVTKATPSHADVSIMIGKDGIENYLSNSEITLSNEDPIIAGDYYFSLEHSIKLKYNNGTYSASYVADEKSATNYQDIGQYTLYVNVGSDYIEIQNVRVFQYKLTKVTRTIATNSFLNKVQTFSYSDQLANLKLFYISNGIEEEVELKYRNFVDDDSESKKYAFYNVTDEEIEIKFGTGKNAFVPGANTKLVLYIYTTLGTDVPSSYTGDAVINISNNSLKSLPIIVNFNSYITGGTDVPSLSKLKEIIINKISTRNTIVTESDLNNYFKIINNTFLSMNGRVTFVKNRDDVLRRVFNTYALLRSGYDEVTGTENTSIATRCIPTNTLDATFNVGENDSFAYPRFTQSGNEPLVHTTESSYDYVCPFYVYVNLTPIKKVKYIYTLTDDNCGLSITDVSNTVSDDYLNPISISVYRELDGTAAKKQYTITATFNTNLEDTTSIEPDTNLTFISSNIQTEHEIDELSSEIVDGVLTVKYILELSDKEFNLSADSLMHDKEGNNIADTNAIELSISIGSSESDSKVYTFRSERNLEFYRNLDDIMDSDIYINKNDDGNISSIKLKGVPVIHKSFFESNTQSNMEYFIRQLMFYIDTLKENLDKLETSTFFNMKFYNTYGTSYLYNTPKTNIELGLNIIISDDYKTGNSIDSSLKNEILSYIRRFIDGSNVNEVFKLSTIVSALQSQFSEIDYIEFTGINNSFIQYIKRNTNELYDYTPEWINLDSDSILKNITFE